MDNIMKYKQMLLIEDSHAFREILKVSLMNECPCMSVLEAATYHEAIELIQSVEISLFLLDIHLPDGSGLDLIQHIKSVQPYALIIVLTANDTREFQETALLNGASQFLSKRTFQVEDIASLCDC
jgi:DNA-binding NarL/FixJ family response regulator